MPQSFGHWGSGSHGTLKMYSHKTVLLTFLYSLWCTETSAVVTLMFVVLSSCWGNTSLVARVRPFKSLAFASRSRILRRVRSPISFTDHVLVKGRDTEVQSVQPRQRDCLSQCPQCQGGQKYVLGKPGSPRKTTRKSSREGGEGGGQGKVGIMPTGWKTMESCPRAPPSTESSSPSRPWIPHSGLSSAATMPSNFLHQPPLCSREL